MVILRNVTVHSSAAACSDTLPPLGHSTVDGPSAGKFGHNLVVDMGGVDGIHLG